MTAIGIDIYTLEFANPDYFPNSDVTEDVDPDISFAAPLSGNAIQTLSTSNAGAGSDVEGLLFVPDLTAGDPCINASASYIPKNVTRLADLPPANDLPFVAFAPWISAACTKSYLNATNEVVGLDAFLFYLVQDVDLGDYNTAQPPVPTNGSWNLGDGGAWKNQYAFPVYAINADTGQVIMKALSEYSGSMQDAPYGDALVQQYNPKNYVRLYCAVNTGTGNTLPSLWVFLLVVLGLLGAMIGITSTIMHFIQRRRRRDLRNRVIAGQVDIEALGIKRLRVPKEVLDGLDLIVYVSDERDSQAVGSGKTEVPSAPAKTQDEPSSKAEGTLSHGSSLDIPQKPVSAHDDQGSLPAVSSLQHRTLEFSQPACPICLDDFVSHETIVRPLPCKHVFHPACIDPVLLEYSSLCPLCKGKVLPVGYCPQITNLMVRRIRGLARMRELELSSVGPRGGVYRVNQASQRVRAGQEGLVSLQGQSGRDLGNGTQGTELTNIAEGDATGDSAPASRPPDTSREDWARQQAQAFVGQELPAEEEERRQEAARPIWRKVLGTIFPTIA